MQVQSIETVVVMIESNPVVSFMKYISYGKWCFGSWNEPSQSTGGTNQSGVRINHMELTFLKNQQVDTQIIAA